MSIQIHRGLSRRPRIAALVAAPEPVTHDSRGGKKFPVRARGFRGKSVNRLEQRSVIACVVSTVNLP
ncbi:MAG: hypothetical protein OXI87_15925 [Albidovulum sp.]|nr:hypothetical protein [Albidovulum sp.]